MKILTVLFLIIITIPAFSQEKVEREHRIDRSDVPRKAILWFKDSYERAKKVKWYFEESTTGKSYEAKLNWNGQKHSVEFDETGTIEDIEVEISLEEISNEVQENIVRYFQTNYKKYRMRKIQRQWIGDEEDLEDAIDEDEVEEVETRYEIEFYGKNEKGRELWEGLFDSRGKLISKRIVKLRPADNLNF
jgi:hypothetical protein